MRQIEYLRATWEIEGSWPIRIRSLSVNVHRKDIGRQTKIKEMRHSKCKSQAFDIALLRKLARIEFPMHQLIRTV